MIEIDENECRFCSSLIQRQDAYIIDQKQSVIEIEYFCGTRVRVEVPGRSTWMKQCYGSYHKWLDNYDNLDDI